MDFLSPWSKRSSSQRSQLQVPCFSWNAAPTRVRERPSARLIRFCKRPNKSDETQRLRPKTKQFAFEAIWTVDPQIVRQAGRVAIGLADGYRPGWRPDGLTLPDDHEAKAAIAKARGTDE